MTAALREANRSDSPWVRQRGGGSRPTLLPTPPLPPCACFLRTSAPSSTSASF